MNFDQDTDALEFHAENMEENNSIRENVTPTQIMEREIIGTGSQQEVMTINEPNVQQPQMAHLQQIQRPMQIQQFGQQFGQPYFQNHYVQTPPVVINPQDTNNIHIQMQNFKQMLDKQNNTIETLEAEFLKIQRELNKLVAMPATPTEVWKRNHVFIDQSHNCNKNLYKTRVSITQSTQYFKGIHLD